MKCGQKKPQPVAGAPVDVERLSVKEGGKRSGKMYLNVFSFVVECIFLFKFPPVNFNLPYLSNNKSTWGWMFGELVLQRENSLLADVHMNMKLDYSGIPSANIFPFY